MNLNLGNTVKLSELKAGEMGIIDELVVHNFTTRLLAMGIIPGKKIKLLRRQPWLGSLYIDVDNHYIGLRLQEAELILIKK